MLDEDREHVYRLIAELDVFLDDASSVRQVREETARAAAAIDPASTELRGELLLAVSDFDKILAEAPEEEQADEAMSLIGSLRHRLEHVHDVDDEEDEEEEHEEDEEDD